MRQALAAVRSLHRAARAEWPDTGLARDIIEVHADDRRDAGVHDDEGVPPIKLPTLLELIRACPLEGEHRRRGIRDRALLSSAFTTMGRRSELGILDHEHVQRDPGDGSFRLWIPKTKTSKKGRAAFLPFWEDYPDCCPVRTLNAWLALSKELGITAGPLFRPVDQWDNVRGAKDTPWAGAPSGDGRLDGPGIELAVARAAYDAVMLGAQLPHDPGAYKPHGLRAGGATSSYEAGADILAIARQGGWGDRSPVIFRYIREVDLKLRNPMRLVGNQGTTRE
jgi:integrase